MIDVDLSDADSPIEESLDTLLELDEALTRLSEIDPAVSDLVKLSYFAGLSIEHAAKAQGIARRTAVDHWAFARAWLRRELAKNNEPSSG